MEQALDAVGVYYDIVSYLPREAQRTGSVAFVEGGLSGPELVEPNSVKSNSQRTTIFRLHGGPIKNGQKIGSSYVLTEEDQIDWLLNLHNPGRGLPVFVRYELSRSNLLSLGHSARDWSQRALLRTLSGDRARRTHSSWAVALRPSPLSILTWQRYEVEVYNADLNDWATEMRRMLEVQA